MKQNQESSGILGQILVVFFIYCDDNPQMTNIMAFVTQKLMEFHSKCNNKGSLELSSKDPDN